MSNPVPFDQRFSKAWQKVVASGQRPLWTVSGQRLSAQDYLDRYRSDHEFAHAENVAVLDSFFECFLAVLKSS